MKFARSLSVCASVVAMTLAALPAASSAQQQMPAGSGTGAPPPVATAPAAGILQTAVEEVQASGREAARQFQLIADAADLGPGEFVWRPELAMSGEIEMVVSIPQQLAYVYRGRTLIGVTTVSTGMAGHRTPTGRYPIIEKRRTHFSNLYNNAPMPFMQRLTMDGIALHAGVIPGYPASHGCVRLPRQFAEHLFGATTRARTVVHIVAHSPTPETALAIARGERPAAPLEQPVRGTR